MKLASQLNLPALTNFKLSDLHWGLLPDGHVIEKPSPVFPRIVVEDEA
jgi:hypothetical protein